MHWLFTGVGLFFALLSTIAALHAHWRAQEAHGHAMRLATLRSRLTTLEGALDTLHQQHRKLSGKFYAITAPPQFDERASNTYAAAEAQGAVCPNWAIACDEGPLSDAAKCGCEYCLAMRNERYTLRARLVPHTAAGQGAMARRNSGHGDE